MDALAAAAKGQVNYSAKAEAAPGGREAGKEVLAGPVVVGRAEVEAAEETEEGWAVKL